MRWTVRTPHVVAACLGFLGGVGGASVAWMEGVLPSWWFAVAVGCIACAGAVRWSTGARRAVVVIGVGAAVVGYLRFLLVIPVPTVLDGVQDFTGRVTQVVTMDRERVRVTMVSAVAPLPVDVYAPAGSGVRYGDVLRVRCVLRQPERFGRMLTRAGECSVHSGTALRILARGAGSPILLALDDFRTRLLVTNRQFLTGAPAALVAAAVLGDNGAVADLRDAYRRTGTIHALVISGSHMTIIGMLLPSLFRFLPLRRRTALWCAAATIAAFTAMVGAAPSAVRGALMVCAFLAVELLGRVASRVRVLLLIAVAMVLTHPHILAFDLAFQLSFAAVAGIVLITPLAAGAESQIANCKFQIVRAWARELRGNIAASFAATVATAPLLLGVFGTFSLLGIIVNIPVLLVLEAFLLLALAFLILGALFPFLGPILAWPMAALADALHRVVTAVARVPWAQWSGTTLDWWFVLGIYAVLSAIVLLACRRHTIAILSPFVSLSAPVALLTGSTQR